MDGRMKTCRHCNATLTRTLVDLGTMPLANSYIRSDQLNDPQPAYPLHAMVCDRCLLVQLDTTVPPEDIFTDYDYFSSTSPTWVKDAEMKCSALTERFVLGPGKLVVEVGSNDGYLLRHFVDRGIDVMGIDPAVDCAREADIHGVPTEVGFFGLALARKLLREGYLADVITGTNVFAHCPDINDFVAGLSALAHEDGVVTMEFPHLLNLIDQCQFDTIYHEHYFYFSMCAVCNVFESHGLRVFDVDELPTHGGSIRIYADRHSRPVGPRVQKLLDKETASGFDKPGGYDGFAPRVEAVAAGLREFLEGVLAEGGRVAAYGAPAKGSTLLNYCKVDRRLIDFTVDDSPHKQGKRMPGSLIPIVDREHLLSEKPDYVLILPWNLQDAIRARNPEVEAWGGKWVVPIPGITIP